MEYVLLLFIKLQSIFFFVQFKFRRVWQDEKIESKQSFTPEMVNYVNGLDVEGDILFLKTCGWDGPREITVPFKIYTYFLKKRFNITSLQTIWSLLPKMLTKSLSSTFATYFVATYFVLPHSMKLNYIKKKILCSFIDTNSTHCINFQI